MRLREQFGLPILVTVDDDELDYARALALRAEFGLDLVLVGNGYEYTSRWRPATTGMSAANAEFGVARSTVGFSA